MTKQKTAPIIGIIMGSASDWETMRHTVEQLDRFGIPCEKKIISAHRAPRHLYRYAGTAAKRGLKIIITGAGGAAHLAGITAALTELPVFGIPMESAALKGIDSLLSIVQMPAGIPIATFAIGKAGAINAALAAISVLALNDKTLAKKLSAFRKTQTATVLKTKLPH
jgi:5-(carboxyamino)imidazole ribonucleotide mutase